VNVWPVIVREMRGESRRPWNYWLRLIGSSAILLTLGFFWIDDNLDAGNSCPAN